MKNSQFIVLVGTLLLIGISLIFAVKSNECTHNQSFNFGNSINPKLTSTTYNNVEIFTVYYQGREYDVLRPTTSGQFFQIQRIK